MTNVRPALLGKLPNGDGNGLSAITSAMTKEPGRIRVGIVLFDADRLVEKTDDGDHEIRARIRRIEVITDPEDAGVMERILMRQFERRTGQTTLPFELEQDIREAFTGADDAEPDDDPSHGAAQRIVEFEAERRIVDGLDDAEPEATTEPTVPAAVFRSVDADDDLEAGEPDEDPEDEDDDDPDEPS